MKKKKIKMEAAEILPQPSLKKDILETAVSLLVLGCFLYLFLHFVGQRVSVDGESMTDTLQDHDQLAEDKFTYHFIREPARYDIVIVKLKNQRNKYYIKRVIALPGETIQIVDGTVYINGEAIEDPYAKTHRFSGGRAAVPITLGEDEYFVMGDNRTGSEDSRYSLGNVERWQISGRAVFRLWPLRSAGSLKGK